MGRKGRFAYAFVTGLQLQAAGRPAFEPVAATADF